ncbi:MAG: epoxyqueuosine reductase QueH [Clostridia bacterium]|nr:epoxyqueuosine reductase QueH [Clostridia bacterium]
MEKPRILLHSCCAPCSTAVLERLIRDKFQITILYYNPNIYPEAEYIKRKNEEIRYISILMKKNPGLTIDMIDTDYESEKFYEAVKGLENEPEGGARCPVCYKLRLEKTAKIAKEKGFDIFGTTLTVSPYKDADKINAIGLALSKKYEIDYLVSNFKKQNGYQRSIELSKENQIYRQCYCGCEFALKQQLENEKKRKNEQK